MAITGRTLYTWASSNYFVRVVTDEYAPRFDAKYQYTKDIVLGALTSGDSYIDLGALEVGPLSMHIEFETEAARNTCQGTLGITATLSNTRGRSYTATLVAFNRIDTYNQWLADATWEAR